MSWRGLEPPRFVAHLGKKISVAHANYLDAKLSPTLIGLFGVYSGTGKVAIEWALGH